MQEMIKDLYINYIDGYGTMPRKCYLLNERLDTNIKELKKRLRNKKDKKRLEKICNDYEEINTIECDESFACGFSFAVQLLSEAFSRKV